MLNNTSNGAHRPGVLQMLFELTVLPFVAAATVTSVFFLALIRDTNRRYAIRARAEQGLTAK
jgi:hypothetical protein